MEELVNPTSKTFYKVLRAKPVGWEVKIGALLPGISGDHVIATLKSNHEGVEFIFDLRWNGIFIGEMYADIDPNNNKVVFEQM